MAGAPGEAKARRLPEEPGHLHPVAQAVAVKPARGGEHDFIDASFFQLVRQANPAGGVEELEEMAGQAERVPLGEGDGDKALRGEQALGLEAGGGEPPGEVADFGVAGLAPGAEQAEARPDFRRAGGVEGGQLPDAGGVGAEGVEEGGANAPAGCRGGE